MGQGLRRPTWATLRPRWTGRAAPGPAARLEGCLPGRGARGRDGRSVRLLPARQGRSAAPSIDTAMRSGRRGPCEDHLHPASGIALACAADGEKLTAECFGDRVVWVQWRRPGFQLGLDIAGQEANPQAVGCVLGGHGVIAWGATSESARPTRCTSSAPPRRSSPTGPPRTVRPGPGRLRATLPDARSDAPRAAAPRPARPRHRLRRPATGRPPHGLSRRVADFPLPRRAPAVSRPLGTSCP